MNLIRKERGSARAREREIGEGEEEGRRGREKSEGTEKRRKEGGHARGAALEKIMNTECFLEKAMAKVSTF